MSENTFGGATGGANTPDYAEELQAKMDAAEPNFDGDEYFLRKHEWLNVDTDKYLLDFTEPYTAPKYTLSYNGIGFAPLGGIHAMTGQSGNGKTMTLAQLMAAILGGEVGGLRYELENEVPKPMVLYIDTEMERDNTIAVKNRVLTMAGREINQNYDDFKIIMLREAQSDDKSVSQSAMRWKLVLKALYEYRPTVAFLDGLLDVVHDFNDNKECAEIIYECMQCATHYKMSLWTLIHQNPGATKMVGHAGSMVERKVTDVFETTKEKNGTDVTFTVKQKKARGRDIEDWQFKVMPIGSWGIPEQVKQPVTGQDNIEDIKSWLSLGRYDIDWPATVKDIKRLFKERGGVTNTNKQQADVDAARNRGFLIPQDRSEMEKGQRVPKLKLNPTEFLEDQMPW